MERCRSGKAGYRIRAAAVRPAIVVSKGLPEMIAVGERLSGNLQKNAHTNDSIRTPLKIIHTGSELLFKGGKETQGFFVGMPLGNAHGFVCECWRTAIVSMVWPDSAAPGA